MQEVLQELEDIRAVCHQHAATVASSTGRTEADLPAGVFGMCYNKATLTLELTSHYAAIWSQTYVLPLDQIARNKQENAERIILISKSLYIHCLSSIEYAAKESLPLMAGGLKVPGSRIYRSGIIAAAAKAGIVSPEDHRLWAQAIEIRNMLVHNNGIADRHTSFPLPRGSISASPGQMAQGNLHSFPLLTRWVIDSFARLFLKPILNQECETKD